MAVVCKQIAIFACWICFLGTTFVVIGAGKHLKLLFLIKGL